MPDPTMQVNPQITDAVTQVNVKMLGESPSEALAISHQLLSHATSLAMQNATHVQGGMQQVGNSATSVICGMILKAHP